MALLVMCISLGGSATADQRLRLATMMESTGSKPYGTINIEQPQYSREAKNPSKTLKELRELIHAEVCAEAMVEGFAIVDLEALSQ